MCQCCSHYCTHLPLHSMIVNFSASLHPVSSLMLQVLYLFFSITDGWFCLLLFLFLVFMQTTLMQILSPWIPSKHQPPTVSWHQPASETNCCLWFLFLQTTLIQMLPPDTLWAPIPTSFWAPITTSFQNIAVWLFYWNYNDTNVATMVFFDYKAKRT